jgi:hypothetical protein
MGLTRRTSGPTNRSTSEGRTSMKTVVQPQMHGAGWYDFSVERFDDLGCISKSCFVRLTPTKLAVRKSQHCRQ